MVEDGQEETQVERMMWLAERVTALENENNELKRLSKKWRPSSPSTTQQRRVSSSDAL